MKTDIKKLNSRHLSTFLTFAFLLCLSITKPAMAQTVEKFPVKTLSKTSITEKEKSEFQKNHGEENSLLVSKIMLLDSEIRSSITNRNLGAEILNQYLLKLNSVCEECLSENVLDERATFVFTNYNNVAAQNLLDFLEEYHTNLQY